MPTFLRPAAAALLILIFAGAVCAQGPARDRLQDSIDRGLVFLSRQQDPKEGCWETITEKHPAVTSLAIMAFLAAGHVPGEGPYQAHIEKGVRWVLTQQQPNGIFSSPAWGEMYQHGICTLMLCEVAAMSDAKTARAIRPKLEKAVQLILQAQRTENTIHKGGWRYRLDSHDADMSVTGWQILALRAARNLGCDVPAERIDLAMHYVNQCRDPRSNGYCYTPGSQVTSACTGTGILAMELCGKERHRSRDALLAGSYLLKSPFRHDEPFFYYAVYYNAQAMFQLGNNYWTVYRPQLHRLLLDSQQQGGGWLTNDPHGSSYSTAMALLALTVEYRLLPIYQRDEDSDPKNKHMDPRTR